MHYWGPTGVRSAWTARGQAGKTEMLEWRVEEAMSSVCVRWCVMGPQHAIVMFLAVFAHPEAVLDI